MAEPCARGKHADFAGNRADVVKPAAVEALACFHDQTANGFFLDVIESVFENEFGDFFRAEFFDELLADFVSDGADSRLRAPACPESATPVTMRSPARAFGFVQNLFGNDVQLDFALFLCRLRAANSFCAAIIG